MASQIDITKPIQGAASTQSVRDNFGFAKAEIEANQQGLASLQMSLASILPMIYPVGALYISTLPDNPNTILGFGTWAIFGAGRVMVCQDVAQLEFDTLGETGGEKTHTLTSAEMPSHTHTQNSHNHTQNAHNHTQDAHAHSSQYNLTAGAGSGIVNSSGAQGTATFQNQATATNQATTATNQATTATNQNTGGDGAHNNLQPYIVINAWQRTA